MRLTRSMLRRRKKCRPRSRGPTRVSPSGRTAARMLSGKPPCNTCSSSRLSKPRGSWRLPLSPRLKSILSYSSKRRLTDVRTAARLPVPDWSHRLPGRFLSRQRRCEGVSTPTFYLPISLEGANRWRGSPLCIPWTSGVHIDKIAICYFGGGLKVFWPFRDGGAGLEIQSLPAVFFLAGNDEDFLAGARFAKLGLVEAGNLAQAGNRRRQEVGRGACRGRGEEPVGGGS